MERDAGIRTPVVRGGLFVTEPTAQKEGSGRRALECSVGTHRERAPMKSLLVMLLSLVSAARVSAQVTEAWVARYDGPAHDVDSAHGMVLDGAGNVYVTGESLGVGTALDFATVKYDSDGNQLWVARYDGPASGYDTANAVARDANGNVYVTGPSFGVGTDTDSATVKYDSNGNQLWVARHHGPANRYDAANDITIDAS